MRRVAGEAGERRHAWFACRTRGRAERRAQHWLGERGIDTYLPVLVRGLSLVESGLRAERPLFPGHLLVRCVRTELAGVLWAPGLVDVVREGTEPAPIGDAEVENIAAFEAALRATGHGPEPADWGDGRPVEIVDGPFRGVRGIAPDGPAPGRVLVGLPRVRPAWALAVPARAVRPVDDN